MIASCQGTHENSISHYAIIKCLKLQVSRPLVCCPTGNLRTRWSCGVDPKSGRHRRLPLRGSSVLSTTKANTMSTKQGEVRRSHDVQSMVVWHKGRQRLVTHVMHDKSQPKKNMIGSKFGVSVQCRNQAWGRKLSGI